MSEPELENVACTAGSSAEMVPDNAGFLLAYEKRALFGFRLSEEGEKTEILELPCGKPKPGEMCAPEIAWKSLVEKVGGDFLERDWKEKAVPHDIKWPGRGFTTIFVYKLNENEMSTLCTRHTLLQEWPEQTEKLLDEYTGYSAPVRKTMYELVWVDFAALCEFITCFDEICSKGSYKEFAENNLVEAAQEFLDENLIPTKKFGGYSFYKLGRLDAVQFLALCDMRTGIVKKMRERGKSFIITS